MYHLLIIMSKFAHHGEQFCGRAHPLPQAGLGE
jgi:hypothetical protein